jgi:hypothetical protein
MSYSGMENRNSKLLLKDCWVNLLKCSDVNWTLPMLGVYNEESIFVDALLLELVNDGTERRIHEVHCLKKVWSESVGAGNVSLSLLTNRDYIIGQVLP